MRQVEHSVLSMSTLNQKIITRNSSICLDDREFDQIYCAGNAGQEENTQRDLDQKEAGSNFPDVVSYISTTSQFQGCVEDCNDPDIVRSNSSSDDKCDIQAFPDRTIYRSKFSRIVPGSVSSFSSSSSSKQSTSSYLESKRQPKTSTVGSFSSVDNDDQQNEVFFTKGSTNCVFNQDSVFTQESEDVFYQPQQSRILQQTTVFGHIVSSPIMESDSLLSNREEITNTVLSSERVQKARNRYSSSGYGTGSGGSGQGNSASKTSVHLSQESFCEGVAVRSQGTQTSSLNNEELNDVENDFISRNIRPYSTNMNSVVNLSLNQAKHGSEEPSPDNQGTVNVTSSNTLLVSNVTKTKYDLSHISKNGTSDSAVPLEPQTSGHIQQVVGQNVSVNTSVLQVHKESQIAPQSVRQNDIKFSDCAVEPQIHNTICSLSQQQILVVTEKSNTSYTDSPHHLSTSYLLRHPTSSGSLTYNQFQTGSSSSGSCFLPSSVEEQWLAAPSHVSLAKLLLYSEPGPSESSGESRYHLESLIRGDNQVAQAPADASQDVHSSGDQHIPNFDELLSNSAVLSDFSSVMSSLEGDDDKRIMEKLQRSVRCHEAECDIADCVQTKMAVAGLQNPRIHVHFLCEADKLLLLTMLRHTVYVCDHPKCPFPWCGEHIDISDHLSLEQRLLVMKQWMENYAEHFKFLDSPRRYMKLKPTLSYDLVPVEGRDWVRLCMMGNSRRALLVQPVKSEISGQFSDSQYWVIKKVSTADDGDHWGVYARLRDVNHKSVATLLWAAGFDDHMLVCSQYEGFSLHECLPLLPPQQFRLIPVFNVIQQLTSALYHLNSLGIAYLYWTSKNILVTYNNTAVDFVVKLSNFSCSVLLEPPGGKQPSYDGGHLLLALPRHIITPELRDSIKVEYASDVWGLGCLLHELVTGYPIWYEHRHALDNDFKLLTLRQPPVPSVCPELMNVFTSCWEVDSSKRMQLSDIEIMLIHAFQVHLKS